MTSQITFSHFQALDLRVGTVLTLTENTKARVPAYVLEIDFGDMGVKMSSAQLTENYSKEDLIGRQVVAVLNFPPKKVAGVKSEVLVLAALCPDNRTVLLQPSSPVLNGSSIS